MDFASQFLAFNRGLVSKLALARLDIKRMALAASRHINWIPRVLGPMSLRPGLQYMGASRSNLAALHVDFQFNHDDTALIELTNLGMRVWVDDVVVTRPAVTSKFNDWNGAAFVAGTATSSLFGSAGDVALWKDNDESGGLSQFAAGFLELFGDGTASAIRDRSVAVAGANIGKEHEITIVVSQGQAILKIGTAEGDDGYLEARTLRVGTHSIGFTPTDVFFIRLSSYLPYSTLVDSVVIRQSAGDMVVPTPWATGALGDVRWIQSGDVIFVACDGVIQVRIERQDRTAAPASRAWSVVAYQPDDGPFGALNTGPVELTGSALSGNITVTSNVNFFKATHVGALFRLASSGQQVSKRIQAQNTFTDEIRVTGIGNARIFQLDLVGPTFTATTTVTLQRSVGAPGTWADIFSYTAVTSVAINDNLDNQIIYYRVGVKTGDYTAADDITASLTFSAGSIQGIVRVVAYNSQTSVGAIVLKDLGSTDATKDWYESDWSPRKKYPSAVELYDSRLCWSGKGLEWLSIVDLFDSFDDTVQGDAGPIRRSIGAGPVDQASWLLALNFLLVGTSGNIIVAKASAIDEPVTPVKFGLRPVTDVGASQVRPVKVDLTGVYISRNGSRVYQLTGSAYSYSSKDYEPTELTQLYQEIGAEGGGFVRIAVQRHPNTRIHLVRADGKVVVIVFDPTEQVICLLLVETDGVVEDVQTLPGYPSTPTEDRVYYSVKRIINGNTVRYLEKWALQTQIVGAVDNRIADSFIVLTGARGPLISGLSHLEGKQVVVWVDGVCPLDASRNPVLYTVTGGEIMLTVAVTQFVCIGLPYTAQWQSAKLAVGSQMQAPLTNFQNISEIGFVLADTHACGLRFGGDFDLMDGLPQMEDGAVVPQDYIWSEYDKPTMEIEGVWSTDERICLEAQAPLPCTVMGILVRGEGHDK